MEVTRADGDPDLQVRLQPAQPKEVWMVADLRAKQQHGQVAAREGLTAVPLADATNDRCRDGLLREAHVLDDPACELIVARTKVVDVRSADLRAVGPLELLRESGEELDGVGQRVDRAGI